MIFRSDVTVEELTRASSAHKRTAISFEFLIQRADASNEFNSHFSLGSLRHDEIYWRSECSVCAGGVGISGV